MPTIPQTRFVILGQQRTGTNHLLGMLGSHPDVLAFGEIVSSPTNLQWGCGHDDSLSSRFPSSDAALVAERNAAPLAFLHRHVFGPIAASFRAVGFKLFYEHCRNDKSTEIWDWLRTSTEIRILHLKRRNILRTLLSKRLANATNVWYVTAGDAETAAGESAEPSTIALEFKDCREFFERTLMAEREADWFFRHHACHTLYYEDMEKDPAASLAAVQAFLGVRQLPGSSDLVKQQTLPLALAIENHEVLKQAFAGSHFRVFFGED